MYKRDETGRIICNGEGDELILELLWLQLYRDKQKAAPGDAQRIAALMCEIAAAVKASEARRGYERTPTARYITSIRKIGGCWYEINGVIGSRRYQGYTKREAVTRYNGEAKKYA